MAPKRSGGDGGGRGGRRREAAPERTPAERAEALLEEAAKLEDKGDRFTGEEGQQAYLRAIAKYQEVMVLPGVPAAEFRQDALEGLARSQRCAAGKVEGAAASLPLLEAAYASYGALLQISQPAPIDSLTSAGEVDTAIGEFWTDRSRPERAVPLLQQAIQLYERAWAQALALPDDGSHRAGPAGAAAAPAADDGDAEPTRLAQLVGIAVAASEALVVLAKATGDVGAFDRATAMLAEVHQLDGGFRHPEHHVQWAAVLTAWADQLWSAAPPAARHGIENTGHVAATAGSVPRAPLEAAVARADAASVSPWVDPVECLCGRSDTLVTFADMIIAADLAHANGAGPRWDGPSAVQLIQRAARDLETALRLEEDDPASILASMGDLHLSLFRAQPDPALPSAAGQAHALRVALDWYRRARSVPFKPYRNLETAYNMATVYALVGAAEDGHCAEMLEEWLALLQQQRGEAREAAAVALADLTDDADFTSFLQRPLGAALLQRLQGLAGNA